MRFERHQFHEAQADAEEAIKINPNYLGAQTLKGKCLYAAGNRYAAVEAFQAALRREPTDFDANLYLGVLYSDCGITLLPGHWLSWNRPRFIKSEGDNTGRFSCWNR